MDNYNGEVTMAMVREKDGKRVVAKERTCMACYEFAMVLCTYFVSGGMYPVESMGFAQITYLTRTFGHHIIYQ